MQLMRNRGKGRVAAALGIAIGNLLATGAAQAQAADTNKGDSVMTEPAPGVGTTTVDTAVLFYQERGGRVQAIEPTASITVNQTNGDVLTGSFTYDSLTGATPNGAIATKSAQSFTTTVPIDTTSQSTTTGASGRTVVVTSHGTKVGQRTYSTAAGALPVDPAFQDHRYAGNVGYSFLASPNTHVRLGGAASFEQDFDSYSINTGVSQDLNGKNTTLSLDLNFELDRSHPMYGAPTGMASIQNLVSGGSNYKSVFNVVAGVTQTITPGWLMQLNYSFGTSNGYQNDPYKFVTVFDPSLGFVADYLYENRPRSRTRQSVYWGNKFAIGPTVTDLSLRYYHDSWGVDALTVEASERIGITRSFYIEPTARYYHQTAASFFQYYLTGTSIPSYASADSRLSRFDAWTFGGKIGFRLTKQVEFWLDAEDYKQDGQHSLTNAPALVSNVDVFGGVHAYSIMSGLKFKL